MIIGIIFFVCIGACVGSFLTMASYRIPRDEEIVFKESHCPRCNKILSIRSLIPIVSYLMQKGKCLECGEKIDPRYFIIELVNTLAYFVLYLFFGASFKALYLCLLFSALLLIIIIDLEHYEVPLCTQILLLIFAIVHIVFNPINPVYSAFCSLTYFVIIEFARIITEIIKKKDVLGGGDTKLVTICGFFLGIKDIPVFLLLTGIFGVFFSIGWKLLKKKEIFPFAPAIVMSLFILVLKYYGN